MDKTLHEIKTHGSTAFPYAVYGCLIPQLLQSYPLHWHDEMEIIYVHRGAIDVTSQAQRFTVTDKEIVLIPPQTVHSIDRAANSYAEYYNILFGFSLLCISANDECYDNYFKPLYTHAKHPPTVVKQYSELHNALLPHVQYLVDHRRTAARDKLMTKSRLFAIMHYISEFSEISTSHELSLRNNYDKLKNLLAYVQAEYGSPITVQTAADMCSYSTSHFMKLFKELTGKSFTRYLIEYRLEVAAKRLIQTSATITDIALESGFDNMSYFTRSFNAHYGISPSQYRKNKGFRHMGNYWCE